MSTRHLRMHNSCTFVEPFWMNPYSERAHVRPLALIQVHTAWLRLTFEGLDVWNLNASHWVPIHYFATSSRFVGSQLGGVDHFLDTWAAATGLQVCFNLLWIENQQDKAFFIVVTYMPLNPKP